MTHRKAIQTTIFGALASIALAFSTSVPASAASLSGTASCPPRMVAGISGYSEQRNANDRMILRVGGTQKISKGIWRLEIDTNHRKTTWYASSPSLRKANGYCSPRY